MGMRPFSPGANSVDRRSPRPPGGTCRLTARCASASPGPALTSTTTPPCSSSGRLMSRATTSMPAMSRPTTRRRLDRARRDLRMHAVGNVAGRASGAEIRVAANQHPRPRCRHCGGGQALFGQHGQGDRIEAHFAQRRRHDRRRGGDRCFRVRPSSATVRTPSPTTWAGSRRAAATTCPPITRIR